VEFDGQEARIVQASARSSEGGSLTVTGTARFNEEKPALNLRANLEGLTVNEPKLPVIGGAARGAVFGTVTLAGTTERPRLEGDLQLREGFLYLPAEFETVESGEPLPIDPTLNLRVATAEEFLFRNPNLDARMVGNLQISGSVRNLAMDGTFSIRGGALSLPTARLRLEPDSLVRISYPYTTLQGETIARIDLDVRASTSVVATDFTGDPMRYRVEVDIRGALDDPERLQMTARSDPPGLSEQTILSLLGRGEVLSALARGADPAELFRQQIGEILSAQVLPGLLAPIETGIAQAFDLEQFSLDYTGLQPATIYLVKNLFNGVGIAYRRTLSGGTPSYQVRLFYRLPFRNPLLQRLRVGFGFDERDNRFVFIEGTVLFR
ncbi:MAG: translocation/assembly module TamB domain-containing protein, partial [Fimbriimonadales bacterium]